MIEFVYRENAKETGPERKIELPKNVRQIGDPEDRRKIYIEDYVITYLRRLAGEETLNSRVAILLGHTEQMDGLPYLFIRGAVGLKKLEYTENGIPFTDEIWAEVYGAMKYFGQGAGRYPTAANVVQDCLDLLTGEDGFYTETARPMAVEADAVAHPYYVRTRTADPWLESVTADRWDSGVITGAVPVGQMLRWAAAQRQRDPGCFVAGIR